MEKGLSQLCLWGGGSSAGKGSLSFPDPWGGPCFHPAPYLQPLCGLGRLGSQARGGGGGDFPDKAPTPSTAA